MAGGKVSARQKMINLMYLVFIAMMAMQMSKEVLDAFGRFESKFSESNQIATEKNEALLADLLTKAEEKPQEFAVSANKAKQVNQISNEFIAYLEGLKIELAKAGKWERDEQGRLPFSAMEKPDVLDQMWFTGDKLSKPGQAVVDRIEKYKTDIKNVLGDDIKYKKSIENFERRFDLSKVANKDGKKLDWLDYNFKGFPAIASYTKLTAMQNDVKITENNMFNLFLGNTLTEAVSLKNYKAIVLADKSAFFAGEKFQGKVVLGKYANVTPTNLVVQGKEVDLTQAIDSTGAATLDFNVGSVGEKTFDGQFTFLEDGKPLEIPITGNYVVVPRPDASSVEVVGRNTLFRNFNNKVIVSVPGISSNSVSLSTADNNAQISDKGNGQYEIRPKQGQKIDLIISGDFSDGSKFTDRKEFFIRRAPEPTVLFNGKETGRMAKRTIQNAAVSAIYPPAYGISQNVAITSFKVKIGARTFECSGNRLSQEAKNYLQRAPVGFDITIKDILYAGITSGTKTLGPSITIN